VGMSNAPEFFLPPTSHEGQEESFAFMANGLNRPVPAIGERLKSRKSRLVKDKNIGWEVWFDDPALVLAIFPPVPYFVVVLPDVHSHFRGQAFAATPIGIERFSHSSK
jgi:hypothetical protein